MREDGLRLLIKSIQRTKKSLDKARRFNLPSIYNLENILIKKQKKLNELIGIIRNNKKR